MEGRDGGRGEREKERESAQRLIALGHFLLSLMGCDKIPEQAI